MTHPTPLLLFCVAMAAPAFAQEADMADPAICVPARAAAGQPVAECANRAMAACFDQAEGSPASVACFADARERFAAGIRARMDFIGAAAPDRIAAVAGIEVKYDLRRNLLDCDRQTELRMAIAPDAMDEDAGAEMSRAETVRCEATAVGLALVKLILQSNGMTDVR